MLVVSTSENGIKILANADCVQLLHSIENQVVDTSRVAPAAIAKVLPSFNFYRFYNVSFLLNYIAYFSRTNNQYLNLVIPVQLLEQALDISRSPHKHWSF